ncbi:MAG: hypothetical protein PUC65_14145 [Clostridiales bacterium]|nr:hypothetical protein [Clostridiales bacterium]
MLKAPTEGRISYNEKEITTLNSKEREQIRRNEFGFVFQKHYLVPYMSALDNVIVAAIGDKRETVENAKRYLKELGLNERELNHFQHFII